MYWSQSLRSATSFMENFQRLPGSSMRSRKRLRCSSRDTLRKNLRISVPLRARWRSKARISSKRCCQISLPTSCFGSFWRAEQFLVHTYGQHFLVMRAIENTDASVCRQPLRHTPEEIVLQFLRTRLLEGMNLAALRIDAAHHVLDDAVLAGGVHRLQHDQHRPAVFRVKALLQFGELLDAGGQHRLGFFLIDSQAAALGRIVLRQPEFIRLVDTKSLGDAVKLHSRKDYRKAKRCARNAVTKRGIAGSKSATLRTIRMSASSGCRSRAR